MKTIIKINGILILKIRLSWTFLFILCVIPALGIGQSYADTSSDPIYNTSNEEYTVNLQNDDCPVLPVNVSLRIKFYPTDLDIKTDSYMVPYVGPFNFVLPCGGTNSFTFRYHSNNIHPVYITILDSDVRVSTGILTPHISSTTRVENNVTINVNYTFTAFPGTSMSGGKGQEGAVAPAMEPLPLPEDENGAYYPDTDPRVYAWFNSMETCLSYLDPALCVWPKVIIGE